MRKTPVNFYSIKQIMPDMMCRCIMYVWLERADKNGRFVFGYAELAKELGMSKSWLHKKVKKILKTVNEAWTQCERYVNAQSTKEWTVWTRENYQSQICTVNASWTTCERNVNLSKSIKNSKSSKTENNTVSRTSRARQSSTASSLSCPSPAHGTPPPTPSPSQPSPRYTREFEEVRNTYPLKKGKDVAHRERVKLDDYTKWLVRYAIQQYASETIKKKTKYIKHWSTRMRQKVYLDYQDDYDAQAQRNPQVTEKARKLTPTEIRMQKPSKYGYGTVCRV